MCSDTYADHYDGAEHDRTQPKNDPRLADPTTAAKAVLAELDNRYYASGDETVLQDDLYDAAAALARSVLDGGLAADAESWRQNLDQAEQESREDHYGYEMQPGAFPVMDEPFPSLPASAQRDGLVEYLNNRSFDLVAVDGQGSPGYEGETCEVHGEPTYPEGQTTVCHACQAELDQDATVLEFPGGFGTARVELRADGTSRVALLGAADNAGEPLDWTATFSATAPASALLEAAAVAFRAADEGGQL